MLSSGNNLSRRAVTVSSDIPSLKQCLSLEQIALGNQKNCSGELKKVLGETLGSASEDYSFAVGHPKPPVATEEIKHLKESVQDNCRTARVRANMMNDSLVKLEKYREVVESKKRQRNELLPNERSNGTNMTKLVNQIHRNTQDMMGQRLEDRAKSVGLNKRVRTSVADVRGDGRSISGPRQLAVMERDVLQISSVEEKIRRLPAGGEGWDRKNKKKRSAGVASGRVVNGDRDLKRTVHSKDGADSKLRSCDAQGFRSKSSLGTGGVNKLEGSFETSGLGSSSIIYRNDFDSAPLSRDHLALLEQKFVTERNDKPNYSEDSLASSPCTVIKVKGSRAPRTGSIKMLDSSLKVQSSSTCLQGSSSMAQWAGQRPHKNSRMRRSTIVAPVSNPNDVNILSQGTQANGFNRKTSLGTTGASVANSMGDASPNFKRELESDTSVFEFSESEESGARDNKHKHRIDRHSVDVAVTATQKVGSFVLSSTKNKLPSNDIGDGVRRQGRSGRGLSIARTGIHTVREKPQTPPPTKPIQHLKPASDKNKSKTGRPPSKKLKDRKSLAPSIGSVDFSGESDDDHEELYVAANSARDASDHACSGSFWKRMESLFSSVSAEDVSYLKQQLTFAEVLDESLSQMLGGECNFLGTLMHKETPACPAKIQGDHCTQEILEKTSKFGKVDMGSLEKGAPLYQRVLSALIEEDESEEYCIRGEGKNMLLHYASDDSHCGSCNLIEVEVKDKDRMESEVESEANFQIQKNSFLDRICCDKNIACSTVRNPSMSSSLHSNERWPDDDEFSHPDIVRSSEICSDDLSQGRAREVYVSGFSYSDKNYQVMCLDDRVLLELQSIGLFPETLPDLQEGEEMINLDILKLKEEVYKQIGRKRSKLGNIDKAVQEVKEVERRKIEMVAMDQLIEIAYRKRLACRGNNYSKSGVRKVSRQAAVSFMKRTLARCRKFEDTGNNCFSEPALQEIIFSMTPSNTDAKSLDCVASNTCNEVSNQPIGSVAGLSSFERYDRIKQREVHTDDVIGSASSRVTSTPESAVRDRDQNKDTMKTKQKLKQRSGQPLTGGNSNSSKESDEGAYFAKLPLNDLDSIVSDELGGPQDLGSWLNFDDDGLQEHDSIGLAIPMDDLTDLSMLM